MKLIHIATPALSKRFVTFTDKIPNSLKAVFQPRKELEAYLIDSFLIGHVNQFNDLFLCLSGIASMDH